MSDDDFEVAEPELDAEDLETLEEGDIIEDIEEDDLDVALEVEDLGEAEILVDDVAALEVVADEADEAAVPAVAAVAPVASETEDDEDVIDLAEELHPDDVEDALDVVLRERVAAAGLEDEEEDEEEPDERGEAGTKIIPRRPGEFLCTSCFLVLPRHQLADEEKMLCRDCA